MGLFDKLRGKKPAPPSTSDPRPSTVDPRPKPPEPKEISAGELQEALNSATPPLLIDVRETPELVNEGWIPGAKHMAMSTFQGRESELPKDRPIVVNCAAGMRSYDVACYLLDQGFTDVSNLTGGVHAWSGERQRGVPES